MSGDCQHWLDLLLKANTLKSTPLNRLASALGPEPRGRRGPQLGHRDDRARPGRDVWRSHRSRPPASRWPSCTTSPRARSRTSRAPPSASSPTERRTTRSPGHWPRCSPRCRWSAPGPHCSRTTSGRTAPRRASSTTPTGSSSCSRPGSIRRTTGNELLEKVRVDYLEKRFATQAAQDLATAILERWDAENDAE